MSRARQITAWTQDFYRDNAHGSPFFRQWCRARFISETYAAMYAVGLGSTRDELVAHLARGGYSVEDGAAAGVLTFESGMPVDKMAQRVTFPFMTTEGGVLGFGGRTILGDSRKYLNTTTTEGFKKGQILYGLSPHIKYWPMVFLVEGYTDVIALRQAGYSHVLAICGTSLTEAHIRLLRRLTDSVSILMDGDAPGQQAASTCAYELARAGVAHVREIVLPQGHDPASYVNGGGILPASR